MYKASKRRFDEDAEFKDRARKAVTQLQGGDPQSVEAWQRICAASRKVHSLALAYFSLTRTSCHSDTANLQQHPCAGSEFLLWNLTRSLLAADLYSAFNGLAHIHCSQGV